MSSSNRLNQIQNQLQNTEAEKRQRDLQSLRAISLQDLQKFNGINYPQTFISVDKVVFDVTGISFYKTDSAYGIFAGNDCSVNLSKQSLESKWLNKIDEVELNDEEKKALQEWYVRMESKYRKVAVLKL